MGHNEYVNRLAQGRNAESSTPATKGPHGPNQAGPDANQARISVVTRVHFSSYSTRARLTTATGNERGRGQARRFRQPGPQFPKHGNR